jgi:indolepyruvate ferredoxin oxidoreductase alpha subunit
MTPDIVFDSLATVLGAKPAQRSAKFADAEKKVAEWKLPSREWAFCAGCPHRASFWVMKTALKEDDREGVLIGDIGCYSMGVSKTGYNLSRTLQCMGAGIGFANGLGNLQGFNQPVIAIAGDSTFYHSCLPGLVNMKYNKARMVFIVLDNSGTAMTGFQPHPGTGKNALGQVVEPIAIEKVCEAVGIPARVVDPFEFDKAIKMLDDALEANEPRVLIFRHKCALIEGRERKEEQPKVFIDQETCIGDECGCNRICSRVFGCPALIWDEKKKRAVIDDVVCTRCGICVKVCPRQAIQLEAPAKKTATRK